MLERFFFFFPKSFLLLLSSFYLVKKNSSWLSILVNWRKTTKTWRISLIVTNFVVDSFGWILQKIMFICDMGTIQSYLEIWKKRVNFGNGCRNSNKSTREKRYVMWWEEEEKIWILVISLPKFLLPLPARWSALSVGWSARRETNCGNQVVEIVGEWGERK